MLLGGVDHLLGSELLESADNTESCVARLDDVIDISVTCCIVGVAEEFVVLCLLLLKHLGGIVGSLRLLGIKHLNGSCATHNRNLGCRPGIVHIAAELLARHHDMAAAVALAECDGDLGHCSLSVSIEELGSVKDDTVVLLTCAGKEARNVNEGDKGYIERIAETNETRALAGCVAVKHTGKELGLIGDNADSLTVESGKTE